MNDIISYNNRTQPNKVLNFHEIGKRSSQEDAYLITDDFKLFAVCDGVGGATNGNYASSKMIEFIELLYQTHTGLQPKELIQNIVYQANKLLISDAISKNKVGSSTTIALIYIFESTVYVTHIGDSRIYYVSQMNKNYWKSKDHSFVQELFDAGIISSEKEMQNHPLKSRITKAISSEILIDKNEIGIECLGLIHSGDVFFLCTDGVIEKILTEELVSLFNTKNKDFEASFNYIKEFCQFHSRDNSTAIGILF